MLSSPWTNSYGVARSLLAAATGATLAVNGPAMLFPSAHLAHVCAGPARIGLFCLVPPAGLAVAKAVAAGGLLVVATGVFPRLTGIPHWWFSFSLATATAVPDGGDQLASVLTLLLIPVALSDSRRWHWESATAPGHGDPFWRQKIAASALLVLRLQVAFVYFDSGLGKLRVPNWVDGSALYYWLTDDAVGVPSWLRPVMTAFIGNRAVSAAATWGTIALELTLAFALLLPARARSYLLPAGIVFHGLIAVLMGLPSFAVTMIAALILYLHPAPFRLEFTRVLARLPKPALWLNRASRAAPALR